jgi:hypothetical protein
MPKTWSDYFKATMDALRLPVPLSLYTSVTTALATIKALHTAYAAAAIEIPIADIPAGTAAVDLSEVIASAVGIAAPVHIALCWTLRSTRRRGNGQPFRHEQRGGRPDGHRRHHVRASGNRVSRDRCADRNGLSRRGTCPDHSL